MHLALFPRLATAADVPGRVLATTSAASLAGVAIGVVSGWPAWGYALVAIVVWAPVLLLETTWAHRHYGRIAFFYVLVVTQGGHFVEHIAQMVQLHLLDRAPEDAHGIFGALDVEWLHLGFNSWVMIGVAVLLLHFPRNPWLWATAAVAGWHQVEHVYIISVFLDTGREGTPGLLAQGGRIGGGLALGRADLHFLYNVAETVPLFVAFGWQLRRTHDAWLARAFPRLPAALLRLASVKAQTIHARPGSALVREGDPGGRAFVVARGEATVTRQGPFGERHVATLRAGQIFGEVALLQGGPRTASVRARTPVELLSLDKETFADLVAGSPETAEHLAEVVRRRRAELTAATHRT